MTRVDVGWRPAEPSDAAFVDALVLADALVTLAGVSEPTRSQLAALQVTARRSGYRAAWPDAEERIVTVDDAAVGRVLVGRAPGRVHLVDVRIDAAHRSRGVGTAVLARLCVEADRAGDDLTLTVDPASPAMRLYERAGFVAMPGDPTSASDIATMTRRSSTHAHDR